MRKDLGGRRLGLTGDGGDDGGGAPLALTRQMLYYAGCGVPLAQY